LIIIYIREKCNLFILLFEGNSEKIFQSAFKL